MMQGRICYRGGYKYQLVKDYAHPLPHPLRGYSGNVPFLALHRNSLEFFAGYAWDGPSGPTIDTPSFMRGSLVHDGLYQLIREGLIPEAARKAADAELVAVCKDAGMWGLRRWWVYRGVRLGGGAAADPDSRRAPVWAP